MMRVTIVRADGLVVVDGVAYSGLDLSGLPAGLHAVQWVESAGHVEAWAEDGQIMLPAEPITSLEAYQAALDAWAAADVAAKKPKVPTMDEIRQRGLAEVDMEHQNVLMRLMGSPTEAERNTWAGKVELARRVLAGEGLLMDQEAFLSARGLDTAPKRQAYANEVMTNSARYWSLVGLADRVRSEAKARIMAVQTMDGWAACRAANEAAKAAALVNAGYEE